MFIYRGTGCIAWAPYYLSVGGMEGNDSPGKYGFGFGTSNNAADNRVASNISAITGKWVFLTGVYKGSALSLYINGQLENSAAASGNPYDAITDLYFGADPSDNGSCFGRAQLNGKLDDVRIYNRALSATEVKQLYNAGR